jgi:hypothetical protein
MSRTRKGRKGGGYDFWSRRPGDGYFGPVAKLITKRSERMIDKQLERQAMIDPEGVRGRIPGE